MPINFQTYFVSFIFKEKGGGGNPQDSSFFQLYPNSSVPLQAISQNSCLHSLMLFLPFLSNPFQSGYCSHHYINLFCQDHSAFLIAKSHARFSVLIWLDLSAACDTMDHFLRFETVSSLGPNDMSCGFLATSTGHSLSVCLAGCFSSSQSLNIGGLRAQSLGLFF